MCRSGKRNNLTAAAVECQGHYEDHVTRRHIAQSGGFSSYASRVWVGLSDLSAGRSTDDDPVERINTCVNRGVKFKVFIPGANKNW